MCKIACRPSIFQIAIRAAFVIDKQCKGLFSNWNSNCSNFKSTCKLRARKSAFEIKVDKVLSISKIYQFKKDKSLLNEFLLFKTAKRRREFVKFCCKRFFKSDLKRKGFKVGDLECRLCRKRQKIGVNEDMRHVIQYHVDGTVRKVEGKFLDKDIIKIFKSYGNEDLMKTPPR